MSDVQWEQLQPVLDGLTERIGRLEQELAARGPADPFGQGPGFFATPPASFGEADDPFGARPGQPQQGGLGPGAASGLPGDPAFAPAVPADVVAMARRGKKVQAIREYRQLTGLSLQDARAAVERAVIGY